MTLSGPVTDPGLCATCDFHRVVTGRGETRYWLCRRAQVDPSFPRYPHLPVISCRGYSPSAAAGVRPSRGIGGATEALEDGRSGTGRSLDNRAGSR